MVFQETIAVPDDVSLAGHQKVTLARSGAYRYEGSVRATGFPSYEVSLVATIIPVTGADGTPTIAQVALGTHGDLHGTNEKGSSTHRWEQAGSQLLIRPLRRALPSP